MQVTQGFRHVTFFKPHGDNEDFINNPFCFFERDLQFLMAVALLLVEASRKADDHQVTFEDRPTDLVLPVLSRLEFFRIQPGVDPVFD